MNYSVFCIYRETLLYIIQHSRTPSMSCISTLWSFLNADRLPLLILLSVPVRLPRPAHDGRWPPASHGCVCTAWNTWLGPTYVSTGTWLAPPSYSKGGGAWTNYRQQRHLHRASHLIHQRRRHVLEAHRAAVRTTPHRPPTQRSLVSTASAWAVHTRCNQWRMQKKIKGWAHSKKNCTSPYEKKIAK
jgi:hypothetical protein